MDGETSHFDLDIVQYGGYTLQLEDHMEKYIQKGNSQEFDIEFKLDTHSLTSGSYVLIDFGNWTIDPATTEGRIIWKYKVNNNIYWVDTTVTNVADNIYKIPVYDNYTMFHSQSIKIKVFHELPDSDNGVFFPEHQWNYLTIEAYNSGDTILEHQYKRIWIEP